MKDQSVKSSSTVIYRLRDTILKLEEDIDNEEGRVFLSKYLYYIEDDTYEKLVKELKSSITQKLKDKFEISLEKKEFNERKLKKKIDTLSHQYKESIYIDRKPDAVVVYFINDRIAGQRVKEEIEGFLGTAIETVHKTYPFSMDERDVFLAVRKKLENILEKMNEKCREAIIQRDDQESLSFEFTIRGSVEEIDDADNSFLEFRKEKMDKVMKLREARAREAEENIRLREEEKKQQEVEFEQFNEFVKEVDFPKGWEGVEEMDDSETKLVDVEEDSKEWNKVEEAMNVKV